MTTTVTGFPVIVSRHGVVHRMAYGIVACPDVFDASSWRPVGRAEVEAYELARCTHCWPAHINWPTTEVPHA